MRELGEELLGIIELDAQHNSFAEGEIVLKEHMEKVNILQKESLEIYYTGFGLDPIFLKPEFLFAIVYRSKSDEDKTILNEFLKNNNSAEGVARWVNFNEQEVHYWTSHKQMLFEGRDCISLAWKFREKLLG